MENEQTISRSIGVSGVAVSSTGASDHTGNDMSAVAISDDKLFALCRQHGKNALFWRQKFLGLLPEVAKRRLYEKHGFSSIFEFGFKLAGVSELQIRRVLNMEEKFRDKKILHKMLISGEISANKLYKIAPIATVENQKILAEQVKILPCGALETLARDERILKTDLAKSNLQNDHVVAQTSQIGLFGKQDVQSSELQLSSEVKKRLLELQKKGIDINELLIEFLDKREKEIEEDIREFAGQLNNIEFAEKMARRLSESLSKAIGDDTVVEPLIDRKNSNRHVPRKIQKIIKKEFGTKCAVPTCSKPAQHLHHTLPFALSQNHDPRYLIPLCKEHHIIVHSIDQKFHDVRQAVT